MIADLLESEAVAERPRGKFPWLLVAASVLLIALLLYVLFVGYLPAKQRVAQLERELKTLYAREAELQSRLAQVDQRHAVRDRQVTALPAGRAPGARGGRAPPPPVACARPHDSRTVIARGGQGLSQGAAPAGRRRHPFARTPRCARRAGRRGATAPGPPGAAP